MDPVLTGKEWNNSSESKAVHIPIPDCCWDLLVALPRFSGGKFQQIRELFMLIDANGRYGLPVESMRGGPKQPIETRDLEWATRGAEDPSIWPLQWLCDSRSQLMAKMAGALKPAPDFSSFPWIRDILRSLQQLRLGGSW